MKIYSKEEVQQGSEKWFELRRTRLTASRMKEVLTPKGKLSAQAQALAVEMALYSIDGFVDPFEFPGNKFTEWGQSHEQEARELFHSLNPRLSVMEVGFCAHDTELVGCSPDGLVYAAGRLVAGLEIKCPAPKTHAGWKLAGQLPKEHKAQVHLSMVATGLSQWWFMSYFPGLEPLIVLVVRDDFTTAVESAAADFSIELARVRPAVMNLKAKPLF